MAKTVYEVSTIVGKYTNKDGQEKNRYQRVGSVIETKNGLMLKMDNIPVVESGWGGWCYLNEPKPKDNFPADDIDF
jgi:hypothetical protein